MNTSSEIKPINWAKRSELLETAETVEVRHYIRDAQSAIDDENFIEQQKDEVITDENNSYY